MKTLTEVLMPFGLICFIGVAFFVSSLYAHCDTLDGPVVQDARRALQQGDVRRVLKWVNLDDEAVIQQAFDQTMKVRSLSHDARLLADMHFFETVVRVHRAGEGVAYTGLKPTDSVAPGIAGADRALAQGSIDELSAELTKSIDSALRARFARVKAAQVHDDDNVQAGRAYVAAYVEYVHFVEAIHDLASRPRDEHHHMHAGDR